MKLNGINAAGQIQENGAVNRSANGSGNAFMESLQEQLLTAQDKKAQGESMADSSHAVNGRLGTKESPRLPVYGRYAGGLNAIDTAGAVVQVEVRGLSASHSDRVRADVENGCVYKGKLLEGREVYVEAKHDDGRVEAYEVNTAKLASDTADPVERMAMDTQKGGKVI